MKRLSIIVNILSTALASGAYAFYYFTAHRMGMLRWVNRYTQEIREAIPYELVKYVILVVVVVATVALPVRLVRSGKAKGHAVSIACGLAFATAFAVLALFVNHDVSHADIFIVALMALAALLQVINLYALTHV